MDALLSNIYTFLQSKMECKIDYGRLNILKEILKPISLDKHNNDPLSIFWVNKKNILKINNIDNGVLISPMEFIRPSNFDGVIIFCENPRRAFSLVLEKFFKKDYIPFETNLHGYPFMSKIPLNSKVGHGTIIEENVEIGKNVIIGYNNVILKGTIIGDNVKIGSNNTIGGIGFGYEKNENSEWELVPHIGNVLIEENVEIGNNNCIDRAVLGSTILKKNCKIDNLVHIAHGATIGENSLIIANSMIAGSTIIGSNTWIAPSTSIINGVQIGSNSMTGLGAVVISDMPNNSLAVGLPAKKIKDL